MMEHPIGSQESRGSEELKDRNGKGVEFAKKGKKERKRWNEEGIEGIWRVSSDSTGQVR
jgi:hypothetical protein